MSLQYPKPKIQLIDCVSTAISLLAKEGFNVTPGSFGLVHNIPRQSDIISIYDESDLPNYREQDIVIVDMTPTVSSEKPKNHPHGVPGMWVTGTSGVVDSRPISMFRTREHFDRILNSGGAFVIFASSRMDSQYHMGRIHGSSFEPSRDEDGNKIQFEGSQWDFLTALRSFRVVSDEGTEMALVPGSGILSTFLQRHAIKGRFACHMIGEKFHPLIKSKHGDVVACLAGFNNGGLILILPHVRDKAAAILDIVKYILPEISPKLFPHFEGATWIYRAEYEPPQVLELLKKRELAKKSVEEEIARLDVEIAAIREEQADLYTLLKGTGASLVHAVIHSLRRLGFTDVVDVDVEARKAGGEIDLREDIQIRDRSPILIVDVKGVGGHAEDHEATQAEKHAMMRIQEWNRPDIKALTIINHQRHLPPKDRDVKAFRDPIVRNAERTKLGLMTTWDLFNLLRNAERLGWEPVHTLPIFYRVGRIEPIPSSYREIGQIVKVWPAQQSFGVIPVESVSINDTLSVRVGDEFYEFSVQSLVVDRKIVTSAPAKSNCGISCAEYVGKLREVLRVFKVQK